MCSSQLLVYISASDEVVDRVMHRRNSIRPGWLGQPLQTGDVEIHLRFATRSVIGSRPVGRAIYLVDPDEIKPPYTEDLGLGVGLLVFEKVLFTSLLNSGNSGKPSSGLSSVPNPTVEAYHA